MWFWQYFEHVEEAEWAVQVLKTTGKPVAVTMCIGPEGDLTGVSPGDCAVRLVQAGMVKENTHSGALPAALPQALAVHSGVVSRFYLLGVLLENTHFKVKPEPNIQKCSSQS